MAGGIATHKVLFVGVDEQAGARQVFMLQLLEQLLLQDANASSARHTSQASVYGDAAEQHVVAARRAGGWNASVPARLARRLKQCRQALTAMVPTSCVRTARLPDYLPLPMCTCLLSRRLRGRRWSGRSSWPSWAADLPAPPDPTPQTSSCPPLSEAVGTVGTGVTSLIVQAWVHLLRQMQANRCGLCAASARHGHPPTLTCSTLLPMVGTVFTASPRCRRYSTVVLPALSSPTAASAAHAGTGRIHQHAVLAGRQADGQARAH